MLTIRPTRITGEALPDDYEVRSGGLSIGRIYLDRASVQPDLAWYWSIYAVHAGPGVMALQGRAATLEEAKLALRQNWDRWLAWAELVEAPGKQ